MQIPRDVYDAIAAEIASQASPVGIDAEKAHIMILHHLHRGLKVTRSRGTPRAGTGG